MATGLLKAKPHRNRKAEPTDWGGVWMSEGRLVSHIITEPGLKQKIEASRELLRQNPEALKAYYVKRGMLTPGGKLTKRYGG